MAVTIHPKLVFSLASIMMTIVGVSYILFPVWNAHLIFGDRMLRSAEGYSHLLMQCLGGACVLLATAYCTMSHHATENMCKTVALGHMVNVCLKIFSLIAGWSGDVRKGAYEQAWPAYTHVVAHSLLAAAFWLSSKHPEVHTGTPYKSTHATTTTASKKSE